MIYRKLTAIALLLLLAFFIIPQSQAFAANDDFEVEYEFFPDTMGFKGGDAILTLTIRNTGSANITWVDVVINTLVSFNQRWTGTITPGMTRTIAFTVPFNMGDINNDKLLQVSMNNNSSSNPDGVKMFRFQIELMNRIFENGVTRSPTEAVYNIGDSVQIAHTFKNKFETHATLNTRTRISVYVNGELRESEEIYHGTVFPDASITHITDLLIDESCVGEMRILSDIYFTLMDNDYDFSGSTATLTVAAPEPDIDFIPALYATPAVIDAGDAVIFRVIIENRGDEVDKFEIRNSEGGLIAFTDSAPTGSSRTVAMEFYITEASDISFVVIGYAGEYSESQETNIVHITLAEPSSEETVTPAETPTPSPTPEITPAPSPADEEASPGTMTLPSASAITSPDPPSQTASMQVSDDEKEGLSFGAFALIVLAALIIAAIIILSVILIKRRKSENVKDSDFE